MIQKLFHDQSPQKYGTGLGSNLRPLDLQSDSHLLPDMLPTLLHGPVSAGYTAHFKNGVSKVQNYGNFALSPMGTSNTVTMNYFMEKCHFEDQEVS